MRILFLGYVVSADEANELSGASVAGNTMQLEFIREMNAIAGVELDVCSLLPVATFPVEPRKRIRANEREIIPGIHSYMPGFFTLPLVKQPSQIISLTHAAAKLASRGDYDYVLTFNMFPHTGVAAWLLKMRFGIPMACMLADPPVETVAHTGPLVAMARKAFNAWSVRLLRSVDEVISLTSAAARMYTPNARAIVIDGAVSERLISRFHPQASVHEEKAILFTGALTSYNGIVELVEAMQFVTDPRAVLHVYGGGPLSEFVGQSASTSENIVFHGRVESFEIPALLRDAFLLVNPRQIDHPVSSVTFPSKVLEYMASGTPVLTTRLQSFSHEYEGLVYFADVGSAKDLASHIDQICELPREATTQVGAAGRRFVLETRTWAATAQRILEFLSADQ